MSKAQSIFFEQIIQLQFLLAYPILLVVARTSKTEFSMNTVVSPRFFQVRDAVFDDAVNVAKVHVQCWHESYQGIINSDYLNSISSNDRIEQRKTALSNKSNDYRNLVACNQKGRIIGFCDVGLIRNKKSNAVGEVYAIYILKEYQRMGIGSALWNESIIYLKRHDLTPFTVTVLEQNQTARLFYEKQKGLVIDSDIITLGHHKYKEICYIFNIDGHVNSMK